MATGVDQPLLPSVSVVIPALNVAGTIGAQLEGLAAQDYEGTWEVVVADNGCTDETEAVVSTFADRLPALQWVDASTRRGINHARNEGARAASGELLLFCDGDDIVTQGWIGSMVAALDDGEAVGGALEYGRLNNNRRQGVEIPNSLVKPDFLPSPFGANCGVRRSTWEQVGGFDEGLDRGACDETDFFWRVQLAGGNLVIAPAAVVHYRLRDDPRAEARKAFRNTRERARLHKRFRSQGYQRRPVLLTLKNWVWVIATLPLAAVSPRFRDRWLPKAAQPTGRLVGSIRYRTLYL